MSESSRDIPLSLQGIEKILRFLYQTKKLSSIRNISENTDISMRVVKNILLQLEKFGQVERIVEENKILPKWQITKFGIKVIKKANGIEDDIKFLSIEDELLHNIHIPHKLDELNERKNLTQEKIISKLNQIQIELSKVLGPVLNLNNPVFEDLISFSLKRIKYLRTFMINIPKSPIDLQKEIREIDEKKKATSKIETKKIYAEIVFLNSLIINQLNRISNYLNRLSQLIENQSYSSAFSITNDLREELRFITKLINLRESIKINFHVFSEEQLKQITKNELTINLLEDLIEIPMSEESKFEIIKNIVLEFIHLLNKGQKNLKDHNYEITETVPLYELYQLVLDEKPQLSITIEELEKIVNLLADKEYIPGIKKIEGSNDYYLKVVQLKPQDINEDETKLITLAIQLQKFSIADIVSETGWHIDKIREILEHLSEIGILKYSKSFLHGDQWYIVSEKKP
ncbi:MAG: hypothetical protein ACFFCE_06215 [Promethearchaeota archaeon]